MFRIWIVYVVRSMYEICMCCCCKICASPPFHLGTAIRMWTVYVLCKMNDICSWWSCKMCVSCREKNIKTKTTQSCNIWDSSPFHLGTTIRMWLVYVLCKINDICSWCSWTNCLLGYIINLFRLWRKKNIFKCVLLNIERKNNAERFSDFLASVYSKWR